MNDFEYQAPKTVEDAVTLLAGAAGRAKLLAGGTDILVQLREGLRQADLVVDIKKIPEVMQLDLTPGKGLIVGAAVPCYRIHGDAKIASSYAGLADATHIIGAWQIQSRASLGGNLCNASPAADSIPAMIAYGAKCNVAGPKGARRTIPVEAFCTGPGKNCLAPGEMLVSIEFPAQKAHSGAQYQRFIPRNEMDIAVVGVGSWVQLDPSGKTIAAARIGVGAVAPTPLYAEEASQWLVGKPATTESFEQAGNLARKIAKPISDMRGTAEYRVHLVGVLVKRTLTNATARARGEYVDSMPAGCLHAAAGANGQSA
ncbi:MAG: xanthine dehydrogenase family protein subunit M [Planctomycetota bacterium]